MKYKKGQIVNCCGSLWKITRCNKQGFTGNEYDLEAVKPEKEGYFQTRDLVPEGFIT